MASTNLDLVRSLFAARERDDFSSTEWAHPEIEFVIGDGPAPGSWTGVARMAEGWSSWLGAWEQFRGGADEYRELDGEHVLVLTRYGGRGKTSGLEVEEIRTSAASLFRVRDGKVTRFVLYWDRGRALADLGLGPERGTTSS